MILAVTSDEAQPTRFRRLFDDGAELWRTEYFGPPPSPRGNRLSNGLDGSQGPAVPDGRMLDPQSFLVEQGPGSCVPQHFHYVNQFQVLIGGSGRLGNHAVSAVTIHYAGAYTAYGPIVAGPEGLAYFTLRAHSDTTGAQFLPESRDRMKRVPRRYLLSAPFGLAQVDALRVLAAPETTVHIDEADGIGAWTLRVPPGGAAAVPAPSLGGGQSWVVATGSLQWSGRTLDARACLFVAPDERPPAVVAGGDGLELLVLQYPLRENA